MSTTKALSKIHQNVTHELNNQLAVNTTLKNKNPYIKKVVYGILYIIFLLVLIQIAQWYKRFSDKQRYELMMHISSVFNSVLSGLSKIPVLQTYVHEFTSQQDMDKSILLEKYAIYGTNVLYHLIRVVKKGRLLYITQGKNDMTELKASAGVGNTLYDALTLAWSIQASPSSKMTRVYRRTDFIRNMFGFDTINNRMRKQVQYIHAAHAGFIIMMLQKMLLDGIVTFSTDVVTPALHSRKKKLTRE